MWNHSQHTPARIRQAHLGSGYVARARLIITLVLGEGGVVGIQCSSFRGLIKICILKKEVRVFNIEAM